MTIRILLATADASTSDRWGQVVAEAEQLDLASVGRSLDEVQGLLLADPSIEILIIDEKLDGRGLELARLLAATNPLLGVVMLADQAGPVQAAEAMGVGARSVVARGASLAEAVGRLEMVAQLVSAARASVGQDTVGRAGRIIVVAGAKGGVGTSVFALLTAQALVGTRSVGLVDFDLQSGDLAAYLGVQTRRSVVDLAGIATDMPGRVLRETTYEVRGLRLLPAPNHGERAEEITVRGARAVASALRYQFDVSVVAVGCHLTEASAALIEEADQVVLLATPDLPALRAARRTLALWERLVVRSPGSVQVVLNRQLRASEITRQMAGRIVEVPVAGVIPDGGHDFERLMNTASVPDALTPVARAVSALAATMVAPSVERSVDEAVEEIDAARKVGKGSKRRRGDKGQSAVELPLIAVIAMIVFLAAAQGLVFGAAHLLAREAAHEAARTVAIQGWSPASQAEGRQVARDKLAGPWDRDTRVTYSSAAQTVRVDVAVPGIVQWADMRAVATVPVTGR
ncbi:MAG: hypothetical protein FWD18_05650 [Micrococcales bacterium]|nr:hypothetical protein [Micrococcales bacterium]